MKRRAVLYADDDIHWPLVLLWLCQITDVLGTVLFITAVWRGWGDPVPVPDTSEGGGTTCSPLAHLNFANSTGGRKAGVIRVLHFYHLVYCFLKRCLCKIYKINGQTSIWKKRNPECRAVCIIYDFILTLLIQQYLFSSNLTLPWTSDS